MATGTLLSYLPFSPHIRPLHAATYLLGVSLFSISFLVFLNSSVSFVLTDLLHIAPPIGNIVGTLGFVDELVAIVAAPVWGALSDGPLGTRGVAVTGFTVIAASLVVFVNVPNVYPGLLLARMFFSIGAAAVATMVSAILPEMTASPLPTPSPPATLPRGRIATPPPSELPTPVPDIEASAATARRHPTGKLAGLVGLFTGLGALLALGAFLPLPTHFEGGSGGREEAVRRAFYSVALVALAVGVWCLLGLPAPVQMVQEEEQVSLGFRAKRWLWTKIWGGDPAVLEPPVSPGSCSSRKSGGRGSARGGGSGGGGGLVSLKAAVRAGLYDSRIALSYLGGFVARSTSVGISLFIPLFVNHYFIVSGKCPSDAQDDPKHGCRKAYLLAAALTGISQLSALLCAPLFGYWSDHPPFGAHRNTPLVLSGALGVVGFGGFAMARVAEMSLGVVACVVLMGVAQIGGIVGSLGVMGRGIVEEEEIEEMAEEEYVYDEDAREIGEEEPLLGGRDSGGSGGASGVGGGIAVTGRRRRDVKGGIAGVYSLCGGAGILALTKLGGWGFDAVSVGWPFWMLAAFEGMLVVGAVAEGVWGRK
ncbi:uncharacterized protein H6S33_009439 [Morchella sextelata]|uniref:uncharacterized protein n=1 Tax=Morchella sextelata TaxID=1174677 RepID=UPI001D049419|nr:uncharacterized protein H6S33_009439 [Morchella sextelata]KAH0613059.1 hypothetical protein H6S33_009439 [Morchella sextelata]